MKCCGRLGRGHLAHHHLPVGRRHEHQLLPIEAPTGATPPPFLFPQTRDFPSAREGRDAAVKIQAEMKASGDSALGRSRQVTHSTGSRTIRTKSSTIHPPAICQLSANDPAAVRQLKNNITQLPVCQPSWKRKAAGSSKCWQDFKFPITCFPRTEKDSSRLVHQFLKKSLGNNTDLSALFSVSST